MQVELYNYWKLGEKQFNDKLFLKKGNLKISFLFSDSGLSPTVPVPSNSGNYQMMVCGQWRRRAQESMNCFACGTQTARGVYNQYPVLNKTQTKYHVVAN